MKVNWKSKKIVKLAVIFVTVLSKRRTKKGSNAVKLYEHRNNYHSCSSVLGGEREREREREKE